MFLRRNRPPLPEASFARKVASVPEPAAVSAQGTTLRPVLEPPSHAHDIASNSQSVSTADNNDAAIQDLQNLLSQSTLSVPSHADGSIHGVQSLSVADAPSVVTAAPQSVTLGSACRPESANTETSTATTQGSTHDSAQATDLLLVSTALGSATTGSGPVTQNIQSTAILHTENRVFTLGKVNAKTIYSRDIPAEIQKQYLNIEVKLNKNLRKYLKKKNKSNKGLTLTLMMLGHNPRNNEPHIVLTCEPKSEQCVRNYLHKNRVEPFWRGEQGAGFKLEIATTVPQPAAFEVFQDKSHSIRIEHHHNGRTLFATIGGNVTLCYPNGSSQQYGLTVNHLFDLYRDDDSEDAASFSSDSASEESNDSIETDGSICPDSPIISLQDSDTEHRLDVWESVRVAPTSPQQSQEGVPPTSDPQRKALGRLVPKTFVSHLARNRDWALIEYVEQPLSRFDAESKPQGYLKAAKFDPLRGPMPVSVVYREIAHAGRLNAAPTSTVVPGGSRPVSVYTFSFDEALADTSGISGSWIVRRSDSHVHIYGQVVAKDAFGGFHVVPIVDILQDVKWVFKVDMVYLHGHNIVFEEIEGVPARTSLPRFVSPDPKHGDTQSDAVNDGDSSSDTMGIHPSIHTYTINSPVEFHITPDSSQGQPARAASSQQEQIADSSTLEHENTPGRLPQAADAPFDSFAKQHGLVMETTKKVPGDMYPDTLRSMTNLASTYWNQGRWSDAEKLQVEVMKTSKTMLGDEHPDTLTSMHNLALTYWNQGRWGKAKKLQVEVMKTRKRVLGDQHPSTLSSMNNLASTYWNQRRWEEAEKLEVEVMKTSKRVLGDEHPDTLTSMHNLAYTLRSQSRHIEALALIEICFQSRRKVLGKQHPDTQSSLEALNRWRGDAHDEW